MATIPVVNGRVDVQGARTSTHAPHPTTIIENLKIHNYRSCIDTRIELQPDLSILIGPNGAGKTTILNAFRLLQRLGADGRLESEAEQESNLCRLTAAFRYAKKRAVLSAEIELRTDQDNNDVILNSTESWKAPDFTGNNRSIRVPILSWRRIFFVGSRSRLINRALEPRFDDRFKPAFDAIGSFLREMKYYSASQFTNPSLCPVSFEVDREGRRGIQVKGHSRFLYDLYNARETQSYRRFIDVIGPGGIGLINKVSFTEIPTSSIDYHIRSGGAIHPRTKEKRLVVPQFAIGSNTLSPNQLSEGTFKTITLLFYLMTDQSSILLIEEPEVCVHRGLLSSIVELIKTYSRQKQIVLSTHSDFILDKVEPRHIYRVSRNLETGTSVAHLTKTMSRRDSAALKEYLDNEGNLGEYWRDGGLDEN